MPLDTSHTDALIQYALLVRGEQDDFYERQLGPIHVLKYVYLADLFFSQRNSGSTFTGADWKFHHFGPWAPEVHARIEPVLRALGADQREFQSDFDDRSDWVRWSMRDDRLLDEREKALPPSITMSLRPQIKKFGKDTPALLDYVYRTDPMLKAAPGEYLNFSPDVAIVSGASGSPKVELRSVALSEKQRKAFDRRVEGLQARLKDRKSRRSRLIVPVTNPRHDEVYEQGVAWLDELAGEGVPSGELTAEFTSEVWKSPARNGKDVS